MSKTTKYSNSPAGKGDHEFIDTRASNLSTDDGIKFQRNQHYISIEVVRFYLNSNSSIFNKKMASGTVEMKIGDEVMKIALGSYELRKGAKTSPKRGDIILPKKIYKGGTLEMNVYLQGIAVDSLLSKILKDMSTASLGVVKGIIDTATPVGPSEILKEAGKSLVGNVEQILNDKADKRLNFFDPGGQELNVRLSNLSGRENYRLLHRTLWKEKYDDWDTEKYGLKKDTKGNVYPVYNGKKLEDGAWILFKIMRFDKFGKERPWMNSIRKFRNQLNKLFRSWNVDAGAEGPSKETIKEALASSKKDNLRKQLLEISVLIENDSAVLTFPERDEYATNVELLLKLAKNALKEGTPELYLNEARKIKF